MLALNDENSTYKGGGCGRGIVATGKKYEARVGYGNKSLFRTISINQPVRQKQTFWKLD